MITTFHVYLTVSTYKKHLLLTKLCTLGFDFDFINLFTSYLNDRGQCIKLENSLSNVIDVISGVPPGIFLCPLFFLFCIDDLPDEVVHSVYFLFCDDLKLHSSSSPENIQRDINTLSERANFNGLSFHPSKTKNLSFGYPQYTFTTDNVSLNFVEDIKDIGLIINNKLNCNSHIDLRLAKSNRTFNFLRRIVPFQVK